MGLIPMAPQLQNGLLVRAKLQQLEWSPRRVMTSNVV